MQQELYILGGSGHALIVLELAELNNFLVKGYFDVRPSEVLPADLLYKGQESAEVLADYPEAVFFPAIGDNLSRSKVLALLESAKQQTVLIHPDAVVSSSAVIGPSVMVGANAVVNPAAQLGKGTIINTAAIVEHECVVGEYAHIAPGATLLGNVKVGDHTFIGANAVVKQGVTIGTNVIVGAGAVVLSDIADNCTAVGNPAKILKK